MGAARDANGGMDFSAAPAAETEIERFAFGRRGAADGVSRVPARVNGGDGEIAVEPGYIQLWPAEELIANNREYEALSTYPASLPSAVAAAARCSPSTSAAGIRRRSS